MNLTAQEMSTLMFNRGNHHITNDEDDCAVLVAMEICNSMLDGRDPFSRKELPFYRPKKNVNTQSV